MRRINSLLPILLAALAVPAHAGIFDAAGAWRPVPLLAGRMTMEVPSQGNMAPMPVDIMAAEPSEAVEQRVVLDAGDARMVVLVQELFSTTDQFEHDAAILLQEGFKTSPAVTRQGMAVIESIPAVAPAGDREANLLGRVLTQLPDGTVQALDFYLDPDAVKQDLDGARITMRKMVQSLAPGSRPLQPDSDALPRGYVHYTENGPDFTVERFRHVVPLRETAGSMLIYRGAHPQGSSAPKSATRMAGELNGTRVSWLAWKDDEGRFRMEALLRGDLATHVVINAASEQERDTFRRIAENPIDPRG